MEETNFIDMDLKEEYLDVDVKKESDVENFSFLDESQFPCVSVKEEFMCNDQSYASDLAIENSNFEAVFVKEEPTEYQDYEIQEQMRFVPIYTNGKEGQGNENMNSESPSYNFVSSENFRNLNRGNVRNAMEDFDENVFSLQDEKLMKTLMCSICNFKTNSRCNLNDHLLGHSNINFFKCSECDFETNNEALFKTHLLTHSETNMFEWSKFNYQTNVKKDSLKMTDKGCKKSRNVISLNTKLKMINLNDEGISQREIGRRLNIPRTTVGSIIKHKQKILGEVKRITPVFSSKWQRNDLHVDMEKLLKVWIDDQIGRNEILSRAVIQRKARSLFNVLKANKGEAAKNAEFGASSGWYDRFRKRANICFEGQREAASGNEASETFPTELAKIIDEGNYSKDQIFYVDETKLFWKKLPSRTFISKEENSIHGFRASKDRVTLQLGANASGTLKLKPMLIYCAENPKALKNYYRSSLPVIWKSNPEACVTAAHFEEWYTYHFIPAVEEFCRQQNIEFNILLVINDAPSHTRTLNKVNPNVKLIFLPPSITSVLKPMDQCVIAAFKAYYLRRTFTNLTAAIDKEEGDGQEVIKSFWKDFNILDGIKLIRDAWQDVKIATLQGAWKKLCPQLLDDLVEGVEDPVPEIMDSIVSMAKQLELDVNHEDVAELLSSHSQPLSNEDLLELDKQREAVLEEASVSEVSTGLTAEILLEAIRHFEAGMKLLEKHDPNFERSSKVNSIISNAYACYSKMYREMKQQQSRK